jgi:hypothetical protein
VLVRHVRAQDLVDRAWPPDPVPLRVAHALLAQELERLVVGDVLGDRLGAEPLRELDQRLDRQLARAALGDGHDQVAVDLQEVDRQVAQVAERRERRPEVVQGEAAAHAAQPLCQPLAVLQMRGGDVLGDLEDEARRVEVGHRDLLLDQRGQLWVAE